jgi:hypothetical protein
MKDLRSLPTQKLLQIILIKHQLILLEEQLASPEVVDFDKTKALLVELSKVFDLETKKLVV